MNIDLGEKTDELIAFPETTDCAATRTASSVSEMMMREAARRAAEYVPVVDVESLKKRILSMIGEQPDHLIRWSDITMRWSARCRKLEINLETVMQELAIDRFVYVLDEPECVKAVFDGTFVKKMLNNMIETSPEVDVQTHLADHKRALISFVNANTARNRPTQSAARLRRVVR